MCCNVLMYSRSNKYVRIYVKFITLTMNILIRKNYMKIEVEAHLFNDVILNGACNNMPPDRRIILLSLYIHIHIIRQYIFLCLR